MTRKDIVREARLRYPKTKPMNYLNEGKVIGFIEGANWIQNQNN